MQIIIDTEKDSPATLFNMGKWLVLGWSSAEAAPQATEPQPFAAPPAVVTAALPLPPAAPPAPPAPEASQEPAAVFGQPPIVHAAPGSLPPAYAPAAAAPPDLDSTGLPYDARIHNKSRTKKQDGTWKLAKGIDPALAAGITAELRAQFPAPPVPVAPDVPPPPPPPAPPVVPPAPPAPPAAPAAPVSSGPVTFRDVLAKVTAGQAAGKFTKVDVTAMLATVGLGPNDLAKLVTPEQRPALESFNILLDARLA